MVYLLGVIVSLLVAWLKNVFKTDEWKTLSVLVVVSLVAAFGFVELKGTPYWATLVATLEAAGAFYAFILERFKKVKV